MTGTREPQREGSSQAMLRDSGLEASPELRSSLDQLRALIPELAPAPRADLAALLAAGASSAGRSRGTTTAAPPIASTDGLRPAESLPAGVTRLAGDRGRKRRLALVGGAVAGAMTLGAGAVAASSEDFRENISKIVASIFQQSSPAPEPTPEPARPSPADVPEAPAPPAGPSPAGATAPGTPAPAAPPTLPAVVPPAAGQDHPTPSQRAATRAVPAVPAIPKFPGVPGAGNGLPDVPDRLAPALPGVTPPPVLPGGP
ncbi:hypothetical protein BJG92_01137 [Arthrobacter sp. SO5]|uniref:hypothetical protein n=1 Tax=Arthrobacter sp. SO5 TaxID=1897055 RepID=UPI001E37983F|nr:hypothetical protein [Arthrobacter sp. SO5]MCB5273613.1 hypothetical protein [Arthrobacter sp. SO5]